MKLNSRYNPMESYQNHKGNHIMLHDEDLQMIQKLLFLFIGSQGFAGKINEKGMYASLAPDIVDEIVNNKIYSDKEMNEFINSMEQLDIVVPHPEPEDERDVGAKAIYVPKYIADWIVKQIYK
jgi:hypothetical protein